MNIRRIKLFVLASLCLPLCTFAQSEDNVSAWFSVGVEKEINKKFSVEVEGEFRTPEQMRFSLSAGASYKINKYLKLGAGYTFIGRQKGGTTEVHFNNNDVMNGFDYVDHYLLPAHRVTFDVTGTVKLWKLLRISVRERYQYTDASCQYDEKRIRFGIQDVYDGSSNRYYLDVTNPEYSVKSKSKFLDDNVLRSRLKFELDKKDWRVAPYVYVEFHNSLSNSMLLEKIRSAAGAEFKFNKQHAMSLAYILTANIHDDNDNLFERVHSRMHAISVGYNFKF